MSETEQRKTIIAERKQKIRQRYKGVDPDSLDVIPAKPKIDIYEGSSELRVAVYARVSTDDPRQTSSYELQKNYYENLIIQHPHWKLVEIYADEGLSGTEVEHRESFNRMINDCMAGKIDMIITKSVSRFARNIVDCVGYTRQLAAMDPPVGVMFETERINTLDSSSEMILSFMATLAQEESHNKSEIMNASIEMRFKHGILLTPVLLGYDKDDDGNLVINDEESITVRLIFFMFLAGYRIREIIEYLENYDRITKRGNTTWSYSSVMQILQNERYCGDVLARKTFTPNYLDHKSKKNRNDRNQYYKKDNHEPIVTRDDFLAVQKIIHNAKRNEHPGFLPEPAVIKTGFLKGYVIVNPRWAGFSRDDYFAASQSVEENSPSLHKSDKAVDTGKGDFDLRGYEIVRGQFFDDPHKISIYISPDKIRFSRSSVNRLKDSAYIELLVHPSRKTIAVRSCDKNSHHMMKWYTEHAHKPDPVSINSKSFLPAVYSLFGWPENASFRICGSYIEKDSEKIIMFRAADAEMIVTKKAEGAGRKKTVFAYPQEWIDKFGTAYYERAAENVTHDAIQSGDISEEAVSFNTSGLQVTSKQEVLEEIGSLLKQMEVSADAG